MSIEAVSLVLVAAYVLLGAITYALVGDTSYIPRLLRPVMWLAIVYIAPITLAGAMIWYRIQARDTTGIRISGLRGGWTAAWRDARRGALSVRRLRYAATVMVLAPLFFNAFTAWKSLIPVLHPFSQDAALFRLDWALHGGLPYRLLGWAPLTTIDLAYFIWIMLLGLCIGVLAWSAESRILLALVVSWIVLGTGLAMLMSSAGPPYFYALTGRNVYEPLFATLATARHGEPVFALATQRALWTIYKSHTVIVGSGISAFPSIHVAVPSLLAFATWHRSRPLSLVLSAYAVVILIGSVALGWHYAVDGYAGILGTALIWRLVAALPVRATFGNGERLAPSSNHVGRSAA